MSTEPKDDYFIAGALRRNKKMFERDPEVEKEQKHFKEWMRNHNSDLEELYIEFGENFGLSPSHFCYLMYKTSSDYYHD
jgi:hypothetical protein